MRLTKEFHLWLVFCVLRVAELAAGLWDDWGEHRNASSLVWFRHRPTSPPYEGLQIVSGTSVFDGTARDVVEKLVLGCVWACSLFCLSGSLECVVDLRLLTEE